MLIVRGIFFYFDFRNYLIAEITTKSIIKIATSIKNFRKIKRIEINLSNLLNIFNIFIY